MRDALGRAWRALGYLPVTVALVAGASHLLLAHGVTTAVVHAAPGSALNPAWYLLSMVVHSGPAHFQGNMWLFVPFGVALTLLTSNRHVLVVVLVAHVLSEVVWVATAGGLAVGSSGAAFAVAAATLVRAAGLAFQNASTESLQTALTGLLVPFLVALFVVFLLYAGGNIAHLAHFLAFLFGGAVEAMYVLDAHGRDPVDRDVPDLLRD